MMKRTVVSLVSIGSVLLFFWLYIAWANKHSIMAKQESSSQAYSSISSRIENEAKEVNEIYEKHGTDDEKEKSVHKLFDAIFRFADTDNISAKYVESLKERLILAELSYREGKQRTITETNVVSSLNNIASEYELPEWSKTFVAQVRVLRVGLRKRIPNLMGMANNYTSSSNYTSIGNQDMPTAMSPAETSMVILSLYLQKRINDLFQSTPEEFVVKMRQSRVQTTSSLTNPNTKYKLSASQNPRTIELDKKIAELTASIGPLSMTNSAVENKLNQFLTDLGIAEVKK